MWRFEKPCPKPKEEKGVWSQHQVPERKSAVLQTEAKEPYEKIELLELTLLGESNLVNFLRIWLKQY